MSRLARTTIASRDELAHVIRRRILMLALVVGPAATVSGQSTPRCPYRWQPASAMLDVAGVRAEVFNHGGLFWSGGQPIYEVPKGSGVTPIDLLNIWIGGKVNGEIRMSASTYCCWELWPGPLNPDGTPVGRCDDYNRIFNVYDKDIRRYNRTGAVTDDMQDWPWELGAPVYDGDGNPDNYDLAGGDRPFVYGDQTLWWVMNDAAGRHMTTEGEPLGLEVRAAAFAGARPGLWTNYTTFYRYELINRSTEPIEDIYFGFYSENYRNDYDNFVGSDSVAGLAYLYNADEYDEAGWGARPPALGFSFIRGPLALPDGIDNDRDGEVDEAGERLQMTSFISHSHDGTVTGNPYGVGQHYGYLQALWRDGSPLTLGGGGIGFSDTPTRWMYSGQPPQFWSEDDAYGASWPDHGNLGGSRTLIPATGPFRLDPGDSDEIILAIIYSKGDDRLDSVHRLKGAPQSLRNALPYLMAFDTTAAPKPPPPEISPPVTYGLGHHPNPASEVVQFRFELPEASAIRLVLYDLLARQIDVLVDDVHEAGVNYLDVSVGHLPTGLYLYRLETPGFVAGRPLTILH